MTPEQAEAPWHACRAIRPLPVRERTTILAQAIHEGTMTRLAADQVLFALAWTATAAQRQRHLNERSRQVLWHFPAA